MLQEPIYGASLTRRLQEEREAILFELAKREKSLRLLFESSGNPHLTEVSLQLELIQLNEFLAPEARLLRATGLDLQGRIMEGTVLGIQEYYGLSDDEADVLREGFWDAVQAGIGNFAGGVDKVLKKVKLKKEPEGWDEAQKIFQKIAEKEGASVVKDLISAIDKEATEMETQLGSGKNDQTFPYNKTSNIFQSGVNTIASTYDTIVAAYQDKEEGDEGYLPEEVVNEIIEQLRIITQKYISDVEREKGGMYVSFGGTGESEDTLGGKKEEGAWYDGSLILEAEESELSDEEAEKKAEDALRGQESATFKRMSSMKAPLIIAGAGAALGALGWLSNLDWFQDLVVSVLNLDSPDATKVVSSIQENPAFNNLGDLKSGEGLTQFFERTVGGDLGPNASTDNFLAVAKKIGGGDLDQGLQNIASMTDGAGDPGAAYEALKGLAAGGESMPLGEFFQGATSGVGGTIFAVNPGPKIAKTITKSIVKTVVKTGAKQVGKGAAGAAVAMMTGAAPVLAGIGLSAVVAGASLAALRHRAKKKSRMGVLNDLLQTLNLVEPKPKELPPQEDVEVQIVLTNPEEGEVVESRSYHGYSLIDVMYPSVSEATVVAMGGLEGDPELEKTGGKLSFMLPSVALDNPKPKVTDIDKIPDVVKGIAGRLPDINLEDPDVNVKVVDNRKEGGGDEEPPVKPPVPVVPTKIAKGQHAVCVFTEKDGAEVWRILKKVTYRKYASDAKKSKDADAPKFAERYKNYDSILDQLRADGVFVDTPELEKELTKISSGPQGDQYKAKYTRTRKGKRRTSVTGGYTQAGEVASIADIRKNIKGAGGRRARGADKFTIIYLVGQDVLAAVTSAGADEEEAKTLIMNALGKWSTDEKRPKIADLGIADDDEGKAIADALRNASLAENRQRVAVIGIKQFSRVLRENHSSNELARWQTLAGIV
jgi:hypothetical protein